MCSNSNCGCKNGSCTTSKIGKILVIVGGLNWGLVGLGMLLGNMGWNLVHMIFGSIPTLEAIVYLVVGVCAVMLIFGCKCKKCSANVCMPAGKEDGGTQTKM